MIVIRPEGMSVYHTGLTQLSGAAHPTLSPEYRGEGTSACGLDGLKAGRSQYRGGRPSCHLSQAPAQPGEFIHSSTLLSDTVANR